MKTRHILAVAAFLGGLRAASFLVAAEDSIQPTTDKVLVIEGMSATTWTPSRIM